MSAIRWALKLCRLTTQLSEMVIKIPYPKITYLVTICCQALTLILSVKGLILLNILLKTKDHQNQAIAN